MSGVSERTMHLAHNGVSDHRYAINQISISADDYVAVTEQEPVLDHKGQYATKRITADEYVTVTEPVAEGLGLVPVEPVLSRCGRVIKTSSRLLFNDKCDSEIIMKPTGRARAKKTVGSPIPDTCNQQRASGAIARCRKHAKLKQTLKSKQGTKHKNILEAKQKARAKSNSKRNTKVGRPKTLSLSKSVKKKKTGKKPKVLCSNCLGNLDNLKFPFDEKLTTECTKFTTAAEVLLATCHLGLTQEQKELHFLCVKCASLLRIVAESKEALERSLKDFKESTKKSSFIDKQNKTQRAKIHYRLKKDTQQKRMGLIMEKLAQNQVVSALNLLYDDYKKQFHLFLKRLCKQEMKKAKKECPSFQRGPALESDGSTFKRMLNFSWDKNFADVSKSLPVLKTVLVGMLAPGEDKVNISIIASIVLFMRQKFPFGLFQLMNSFIMWDAGASSELYNRLRSLGLCCGARATRAQITNLMKNQNNKEIMRRLLETDMYVTPPNRYLHRAKVKGCKMPKVPSDPTSNKRPRKTATKKIKSDRRKRSKIQDVPENEEIMEDQEMAEYEDMQEDENMSGNESEFNKENSEQGNSGDESETNESDLFKRNEESSTEINIDQGGSGDNTKNNPGPDEESVQHCFCGQFRADLMIKCENDNCEVGWFHFQCVSLDPDTVPSSTWTCTICAEKEDQNHTEVPPDKPATQTEETSPKNTTAKESNESEPSWHYRFSQRWCEICQKLFWSNSSLEKHRFSHFGSGGAGEHKCQHCEKIFATKEKLKAHEKAHFSSIKCRYCEKTYKYRGSRLYHERLEHAELAKVS